MCRTSPLSEVLGLHADADLHRRPEDVAFTEALQVRTSPISAGARNSIASTAAVTTRRRAWRHAAMPAASSHALRITPPNTAPTGSRTTGACGARRRSRTPATRHPRPARASRSRASSRSSARPHVIAATSRLVARVEDAERAARRTSRGPPRRPSRRRPGRRTRASPSRRGRTRSTAPRRTPRPRRARCAPRSGPAPTATSWCSIRTGPAVQRPTRTRTCRPAANTPGADVSSVRRARDAAALAQLEPGRRARASRRAPRRRR